MRFPRPTLLVILLIIVIFLGIGLIPFSETSVLFFYLALYIVASQGFNLMYGYTGYLPFGNLGFFTVGQYIVAIMVVSYGISPPASIPIAILGAVVVSFVLYPLLRLHGIYFGLASFLVAEAIIAVIEWLPLGLTGGPVGVNLLHSYNPTFAYFTMTSAMAISLVTVYLIHNSHLGLALTALKEKPKVAEMIGINPTRYKLMAWILNSAMLGACGAIAGWYVAYINYDTAYNTNLLLNMLIFPVFGGVGTVLGPVVGSLLYIPISTWGAQYANYFLIGFGLALAVVVTVSPRGLVPAIEDVFRSRKLLKESKSGVNR